MIDSRPIILVAGAALSGVTSVAAAVADWAATVQLPTGPGSPVRVEFAVSALPVNFDGEHLRRVLVNLLENALRHASGAPASVLVRTLARDDGGAHLSVLSDGPPIAPDVERHLFEPFFSTRSRGTGLGLYICRELCERYAAHIEYRLRPATETLRNEFVVHMRRAPPTEMPPPTNATP